MKEDFHTYAPNLSPVDGALPDAVPQHAEPQERKRHTLGEEDFADLGRDVGEGISNTSDDDVLKESGVLNEG